MRFKKCMNDDETIKKNRDRSKIVEYTLHFISTTKENNEIF